MENFEGLLPINNEREYQLIREALEIPFDQRGHIEIQMGDTTFNLVPTFIRFKGIGKKALIKGHLTTI